MAKPLVIVESPTKARTIERFLGKDYVITASYGHVRDLPNGASEVPEEYKKTKWADLGVNVDEDFTPLYIIPDAKKKHVKELRALLKDASELLLATDEDREGESISWHLLEILKPKVPVKRLVFHEITKSAIEHALNSARAVDENLVRAQETRRIIDRLFGYSISPILWRKMARGLSAGRVQSVAMRLLVERERSRLKFKRAAYWDLKAVFSKLKDHSAKFDADLTHIGGKRVASGKDFIPELGQLDPKATVVLLDEKGAKALQEKIQKARPIVSQVEEKPFTTKPLPPFTTSTIQQEGSRKLGFAARRTMQVAQMLYENGVITYMRTDSTTLSSEAITGARSVIEAEFGKEFLPKEPRIYKTKVKNAQEAHEAIRPAGTAFIHPQSVRSKFGEEAFKLYELIWKRTLACQMPDAQGLRLTAHVQVDEASFRASGKSYSFPGYLRAYVEGSDDPEAELADKETILPPLAEKEELNAVNYDSLGHETQPPARFTEGSLIQELERLGIGRPSTWAAIVDVILQRNYAFKRGTALIPTFLATALTALMEKHFTKLLDYEFTARLEDDLDAISRGEKDNLAYLKDFYFGNGHPGLLDLVKAGVEQIDPREVNGVFIGTDAEQRTIEVRIGRFGPFITNGTDRASLPDNTAPDELTVERALAILVEAAKGPASLGSHPESGEPIYVKRGRFGPYLQLGEMKEGEKPKMASLLPGQTPETIDLATAVKVLALPKNIGMHPQLAAEVIVSGGKFGPYIKCGTETRSIPTDEFSVVDLTLEQAMELLTRPKTRGRRTAAPPKVMRELGKHPKTDAPITLRDGRYGPYVTDGTTNASLPKGTEPDKLTLEESLSLIEAREGIAPKKKKKKAPAAKKASPAKAPSKAKGKANAKKAVTK